MDEFKVRRQVALLKSMLETREPVKITKESANGFSYTVYRRKARREEVNLFVNIIEYTCLSPGYRVVINSMLSYDAYAAYRYLFYAIDCLHTLAKHENYALTSSKATAKAKKKRTANISAANSRYLGEPSPRDSQLIRGWIKQQPDSL